MKKTCLRFFTGRLLLFWAIMAIGVVCACTDDTPKGNEGNEGSEGDNTPSVSDVIVQMNRDVADMQQLAEGKVKILTCVKESSGRYQVELDNGHVLTVYAEEELVKKNSVPVIGVDADGYWVYELDGNRKPDHCRRTVGGGFKFGRERNFYSSVPGGRKKLLGSFL